MRSARNAFKILELKLKGVQIDFSVTVESTVQVYPGVESVSIGNGSYLGHGVVLRTFGGSIAIGSNCSVHPYSIIDSGGGLIIGNDVRIAAHTVIVASNHLFSDPDRLICDQGLSLKGIAIEDDVWIGAGVRILDGVTVHKGTVVGAGSVVTKSTEPYSIVVGVPAKKVSSRLD
jgi:acetyltransferase-like isoleucine patch superfamily enzyme